MSVKIVRGPGCLHDRPQIAGTRLGMIYFCSFSLSLYDLSQERKGGVGEWEARYDCGMRKDGITIILYKLSSYHDSGRTQLDR